MTSGGRPRRSAFVSSRQLVASRKMRRRLRHVRTVGDEPAQRPIGALRDADARRDRDVAIGDRLARANHQRRPIQRDAVVPRIDAEREAQLPRPIREIDVATRPSAAGAASVRFRLNGSTARTSTALGSSRRA